MNDLLTKDELERIKLNREIEILDAPWWKKSGYIALAVPIGIALISFAASSFSSLTNSLSGLDNLQEEKNLLERQAKNLELQGKNYQTLLQTSRIQNDKLQEEFDALLQDKINIEADIQILHNQKKEATELIEESRIEYKRIVVENEKLILQRDSLQLAIDDLEKRQIESAERFAQDMERQAKQYEAREALAVEAVRAASDAEQAKLQAELDAAERQKQVAERAAQDARVRAEEVRQQAESLAANNVLSMFAFTKSSVKKFQDLDGGSICVSGDSAVERELTRLKDSLQIDAVFIQTPDQDEALEAYLQDACDAVAVRFSDQNSILEWVDDHSMLIRVPR